MLRQLLICCPLLVCQAHIEAAGGEREPQLAVMLAALAQRFQALRPAVNKTKVNLLAQLLWALGGIPAAYRAELAPVAEHTMHVLTDKLGLKHADTSAAVSNMLRAMVRLRLEVPEAMRQQLRARALGAVGGGKPGLMYWVVRAMNEGCIRAPDRDAVEAVLQGLGKPHVGNPTPVFQELQKVTLGTKRWLRQYPVAQFIWVCPAATLIQCVLMLWRGGWGRLGPAHACCCFRRAESPAIWPKCSIWRMATAARGGIGKREPR
jgi:hypothetical protein